MGHIICEQIVQHNPGSTRAHALEKFKFIAMIATLTYSAVNLRPYALGELPRICTATMELTLDSTDGIDAMSLSVLMVSAISTLHILV